MSLHTTMTTRRSRDQEEETMTRLLLDRGLLEPGMTYTDKKDLMSVLKESENMAVVKSNDECLEDMQVEPDSEGDGNNNQNNVEIEESVNDALVAFKSKKQVSRKLYSDISSMNKDVKILMNKTSSPKNAKNDVKVEMEEVISKSDGEECHETDIPITTSAGLSTESMDLDVGSVSNGEQLKSDTSDVDMLPNSPEVLVCSKLESVRKVCSVSSKKTTGIMKVVSSPGRKLTTKDDAKDDAKDDGNINVFDATHSGQEPSVTLQRRFVEAQERFPFYFLQKGISLDTFTRHFKKYVDRYRKNLLHIQRSSINFLEWGKPIPVTFMKTGGTVADMKKADTCRPATSNTYNFRERGVKNRDPYSISDTEDFVDDSVIGIGLKNTYIPDSSGSESDGIISRRDKRKCEQKEDSEHNNSSSGGRHTVCKRIKFSVFKADSKNSENIDSDEDFEPSGVKRTQRRSGRRGGGRARTGKIVEAAKSNNRKQTTSSRGKGKVVKTLSVLMESAEDAAPSELSSQKSEEFGFTPLQSSLKPNNQDHGHVCSSPESKISSQELICRSPAENQKEGSSCSDITFLGSTTKEVEDQHDTGVTCPICGKSFTSEQIEMHASTCDQYSSDKSQSENPSI